jgi:PAS domain S-box-containing protein
MNVEKTKYQMQDLKKGQGQWIAGAVGIVLLVGALFAWWTAEQTDREMRAGLLQRTRLIAQAIDIEPIKGFTGTASDLSNPSYLRLKKQLADLRSANPQCRFLYLMGRKSDGTIFFFVDSEPADSQDYSPPGQVYTEGTENFRTVFARHVAMVDGPTTDRWGTWVTGLVPIHDPQTVMSGLAMPDDARAMVRDAVDYYRIHGRERTLQEINKPQGALFRKGDLYAFVYDSNMTIVAHPFKPELVGRNLIDEKDWPGGKYFRQEIKAVALTKGTGWVDYEYENPVSKLRDPKTTYVERVDDLIICAGAYKGTGVPLAVLGMDIDARSWQQHRIAALLPVLLFVLTLAVITLAGGVLLVRRSRSAHPHPPWMQYLETGLVLAMGATLTVFAAWKVHERELHNRNEAFNQLAASRTELIASTLRTLRDKELEGLAHFYEGSEDVTTGEFLSFSKYLTRNSAVSAWEWIPAVAATDKDRFESASSAGFKMWQKDAQGKRVPVANREVYYPISQAAPLAGNETALGYDIGSAPLALAALTEAARTGLATATEPLLLIQETNNLKGMVVYRPVFVDEAATHLRGFVAAVLRMRNILGFTGQDEPVLLELTLLRKETARESLAISWDAESPPTTGLSVTRPVLAFGKVFGVTAHAGPVFMKMHPMHARWVTMLVGSVLTGACAFVVRSTLRRREELERLVAERTLELRRSEERFRTLFKMAPMPLVNISLEGKVLDVNNSLTQTMGYTLDDLPTLDTVWMLAFPDPDLRNQVTSAWRKDLEQARNTHADMEPFEGPVWCKDGTSRIMVFVTALVKDTIIIGFFDITERREKEDALQKNMELLRATFNATTDGIVVVNKDLRVTQANQQFYKMWQVPPDLQQTDDDVVLRECIMEQLEDPAGFQNMVDTFYDSRIQNMCEIPLKNGRVVECYSAPMIMDGNEIGRVWDFRDISERKQAEEERKKLHEQLFQSQKMEAVGILAGGIAHDFNNMLGAIIGYADLTLAAMEPANQFRKNLERILDAAKRSADITRQLLAFARKQTIAPVAVHLNEAVEAILPMIQRLIGENIALLWVPGTGPCTISIDPSQLDQILINLCVNARDAIADVGRITIETDKVVFDEAYCAAHVGFVPGDYVLLSVSDNGCGIDKETLNHIFEPFFTTKGLGHGTGMGLATIYGIVRQNEGFINVYSESAIGTTFRVYLPSYTAEAVQLPRTDTPASASTGHETILLVEDEPLILEMAQAMLTNLGYTVLPVGTPGEALRLAREHTGEIHLLMTDVVMPEMNGRDLARSLRSIRPRLKRLFMSGYTANVIVHNGVLEDHVHFIQKPFSIINLAVKIREALDQDRA